MCHGKNTTIVVLIFDGKFKFNFITRSTIANAVGATTLDHKVGNDPVKNQSVIKTFFGKSYKIFYGVRGILFKEVDFHHSLFGMDFGYRHNSRFKIQGSKLNIHDLIPKISNFES